MSQILMRGELRDLEKAGLRKMELLERQIKLLHATHEEAKHASKKAHTDDPLTHWRMVYQQRIRPLVEKGYFMLSTTEKARLVAGTGIYLLLSIAMLAKT